MNESDKEDEQKEAQKITFRFLKSQYFRVIHADGVFGGITHQGKMSVAFFSERTPFPDLLVQEFNETTGVLGREVARTGSDGILREIEACVMMDLDTAQSFLEWLQRHIDIARRLQGTEAAKVEGSKDGRELQVH